MDIVERLRWSQDWVETQGPTPLRVAMHAIRSFSVLHAPQAAASIAFYALLSLFPLVILLVSLASRFLMIAEAQELVVDFVVSMLPGTEQLIFDNISQLLRARRTSSVVGILGLLWSASTVFAYVERNLNLAWPNASRRGILRQRLIALLLMAVTLVLLLLAATASRAAVSIINRLDIPLMGGWHIAGSALWPPLSALVPLVLIFAMYLLLYKYLPNVAVHWREAAWGALISALLWELCVQGFAWYLGSSLNRFNVLYGSLGTLVVFMLFVYMNGYVVLLGAHVSAAVAVCTRPLNDPIRMKPLGPRERQKHARPADKR